MSERRKHKMFSLNAYSYNGIVSGGSPKLHVPVQPASVIYAQFDHVSGFAAKANQAGISVSKIHILNSLLNQVISMRTSPKPEIPKPDTSNLTQSQLDSLIKEGKACKNAFRRQYLAQEVVRLTEEYNEIDKLI